ncbi:hypothetical protein EDB86DRAFT_1991950 [Lactarius hatsudake]|nr:hypothetical protein EDB86DRAFT_1991950 [Lactarius hatsudake]
MGTHVPCFPRPLRGYVPHLSRSISHCHPRHVHDTKEVSRLYLSLIASRLFGGWGRHQPLRSSMISTRRSPFSRLALARSGAIRISLWTVARLPKVPCHASLPTSATRVSNWSRRRKKRASQMRASSPSRSCIALSSPYIRTVPQTPSARVARPRWTLPRRLTAPLPRQGESRYSPAGAPSSPCPSARDFSQRRLKICRRLPPRRDSPTRKSSSAPASLCPHLRHFRPPRRRRRRRLHPPLSVLYRPCAPESLATQHPAAATRMSSMATAM